MRSYITKNSVLFFSLAAIYSLAYFIQDHIFINWDVSWLTYLATQLFDQGVNTENFFEVNTPMSIYIYLPAVVISKFFSISIVSAIRLSVFLLATISLKLCSISLKKLLAHESAKNILLLILAFIFLVLPINQFAEREHVFLILVMPYFFSCALRPKKDIYSGIVAIMAAIGFTIKPHFFVLFILIESYFVCKVCTRPRTIFHERTNFFSSSMDEKSAGWIGRGNSRDFSLRPEALIIVLFTVCYIASIFLLQPGYFSHVLPLAIKYYYSGSRTPLAFFTTDTLFLFCISAMVIYFFQRKNQYQRIGTILFLALIGALISYLSQSITTYYRLYPAVALSMLLLSVLVLSYQQFEKKYSFASLAQTIAVLFIVLYVPVHSIFTIVSNSFAVKKHGLVKNLINYMNSQNTTGICYFVSTSPPLPAINYVNKNVCSEVSYSQPYWILSGIIAKSKNYKFFLEDKKLFIQSVVTALTTKKPDFVFVDKNILVYFMYQPFDYIKYFSTYIPFQSAWRNYIYLNSIENFNVYKRVS